MRHNPDHIPVGTLAWEHLKEHKRVSDFWEIDEDEWQRLGDNHTPDDVDIDRMVKFVIYMASQESPHFLESDYEARVRQCMRSSGIRPNEVLGHMIVTRHWWFRRVLMMYLKTFARQEFAHWLSLRMLAFNLMEVMTAKPDPGDRDIKSFVKAQTDASDELTRIMGVIVGLEQQLFPNPEMAEMVAAQAIYDSVNTAESYAADFSIATKFS